MSYLVGRVYLDAANQTFDEHRPGWIRMRGIEPHPGNEHPIEASYAKLLIHPGTLIIEETPTAIIR